MEREGFSRAYQHAHHPAAPLLRRPRFLPRGARALLFQPLDLRRPRRSDSARRRLLHADARRRERHHHPRRLGRDSRAVQRLPPPRHAAVRAAEGHFADRIQCPYHNWTYDLEGRLLAAPHMAAGVLARTTTRCTAPAARSGTATSSSTSAPRARIRTPPAPPAGRLPCATSCRPARSGSPLADGRPPARPADRLRRQGELEADRPQLQRVPALPEPASRRSTSCITISAPTTSRRPPATAAARWGFSDGVETMSMDGKRRREYLPGLSEAQRQQVVYYAIYPNFLLSLHPDYVMTHTLWPRAHDRTEIVCEWHFHPDRAGTPRLPGRRCDRVLGPDEPRRLVDRRAVAGRHQLARLSAGPVLGARRAAVELRRNRPSGGRGRKPRQPLKGRPTRRTCCDASAAPITALDWKAMSCHIASFNGHRRVPPPVNEPIRSYAPGIARARVAQGAPEDDGLREDRDAAHHRRQGDPHRRHRPHR